MITVKWDYYYENPNMDDRYNRITGTITGDTKMDVLYKLYNKFLQFMSHNSNCITLNDFINMRVIEEPFKLYAYTVTDKDGKEWYSIASYDSAIHAILRLQFP